MCHAVSRACSCPQRVFLVQQQFLGSLHHCLFLHKPWVVSNPCSRTSHTGMGLQTTCMYMDHVQIHSEDLLMQSNSCTGEKLSSELLRASERIYYRNILWYYSSVLNVLTRYFHHGYSCNFGTGILVLKSSFPNLPSLLFLKTTRLLLNMNVYINLTYLLYLSTDQVISTNDTPHWNIFFFVGLFLCVCLFFLPSRRP